MPNNRKRKCRECGVYFVPQFDSPSVKQIVCSARCCVGYYDKLKIKTRRTARATASMVGMRSMGEVKFVAEFITGKKGFKAHYEKDTFSYTVEEDRTYTPDFRIETKSGKVFYIEYKGVLDLETRKKMVRVRDQHPELDVRFVFQKARNKIRKGSPTSYGMWCDQNGFKWADNCIPKGWLK